MICPYCGSTEILYAPQWPQHYLRLLINSDKRYCPACDKKWIARPKTKGISLPLFIVISVIAIVSVFLIDHLGSKGYENTSPPEKGKKTEYYMKKYGIELPNYH